jgi:hypothetical protein
MPTDFEEYHDTISLERSDSGDSHVVRQTWQDIIRQLSERGISFDSGLTEILLKVVDR